MDELFRKALDLAEGQRSSATAINRVASQTGADAAAWAFGQWELRHRGIAKFAIAQQMLFVREALEQATHERVAEYHASLFPKGDRVADLTVGIGADLIALSRRGPTLGFELEFERANFANHNLSVHGLASEVRVADCLQAVWDFEYAFADPARRVEGRRTLDPAEFAPNPQEISDRFKALKLGVMKLSPLLPDSFLESLGCRLEFVSYGGECRESLVFGGSRAVPGRYSVHLESGERLEASDFPLLGTGPSEYLYDVDPAAIRAHSISTLCDIHGLSPLGDSNGYLTSDQAVSSPWLRGYRVLYSGKSDVKATRKAIRDLDGEVFEIKQRGCKADIDKLRREFSAGGKLPLSLVLWSEGPSVRHLLVTAVT